MCIGSFRNSQVTLNHTEGDIQWNTNSMVVFISLVESCSNNTGLWKGEKSLPYMPRIKLDFKVLKVYICSLHWLLQWANVGLIPLAGSWYSSSLDCQVTRGENKTDLEDILFYSCLRLVARKTRRNIFPHFGYLLFKAVPFKRIDMFCIKLGIRTCLILPGSIPTAVPSTTLDGKNFRWPFFFKICVRVTNPAVNIKEHSVHRSKSKGMLGNAEIEPIWISPFWYVRWD